MKAECTWGDGPDVMLSLSGSELFLLEETYSHNPPRGTSMYGHVSQGQVCLTIEEAKKLAEDLLMAAQQAENYEDQINQGSLTSSIICGL